MIVSLNEIDSTVRKAFRGGGYSWGEAEEAGKAAVWLCHHDIAVLNRFLDLLGSTNEQSVNVKRPIISHGHFQAKGGELCPILAGCMIADRARGLHAGETIALQDVRAPVLLFPFVSAAAEMGNRSISLNWPGCHADFSGDGFELSEQTGLAAPFADVEIKISHAESTFRARTPIQTKPIHVDEEIWSALHEFAAKTYVPASDRSRLAGAGAGLSDQD